MTLLSPILSAIILLTTVQIARNIALSDPHEFPAALLIIALGSALAAYTLFFHL